MPRTSRFGLALLVLLLLTQSTAKAGPVERFMQIALHPTDSKRMVLRYMYGGDGLFFSDDGGSSFQLLCGSAIDATNTRFETLLLAGDGTTLLGAFQAMWRDDRHGCGWQPEDASIAQRWISALALDPVDPRIVYAATSDGSGKTNGVYRRDPQGAWTELGSQAVVFIDRLLVVRTAQNAVRFYETAVLENSANDPTLQYLVRVSDDLGAHWTEYKHPQPQLSELALEAVDPRNPDAVLLSVSKDMNGTDLFVSFDRGETLEMFAHVQKFGGATFAPDGRLWFGDASDGLSSGGLWFASGLKDAPRLLTSDYRVSCVSYQASTDKLFVCQPYRFGAVDSATGEPGAMFGFESAPDMRQCDGVDLVNTCELQLLNAYCGVSHFPEAPLCKPYGVLDQLGACADGSAPPCSPPTMSGGSTPAAGSGMAGAGGAAPAGTQAPLATKDAGAPAAAGAAAPEPRHVHACSVREPGRGSAERPMHFAAWLSVFALAGATRRRPSALCRRTHRFKG